MIIMASISNILYLTIIATIFISVTASDYCNSKSCSQHGSVHTMCKYTSPKPAAACGSKAEATGLTAEEKDIIVKKHNELRQFVASGKETRGKPGPQPPAAQMPNLEWDNELEQVAQRWSNQCAPGHDSCRDVARYAVGQNMAITSSSGENDSKLEDMIQSWYDEVKLFDKNQVGKLTNINGVGHYTQIVAARTVKIGCGYIKYSQDDWNTNYLICNYGPIGNILYQEIYTVKK